jgi:peptidoglycan/LPS O-acetylase OafA/YrhL
VAVLQTPALLLDGDFRLGFGVIPPVWTLSVEVCFYVVLPLTAAWYFRRPFLGLAAAAVMLVAWRGFAEHSGAVAGRVGIDLSQAAQGRLATNYGSQFPNWAVALAAGMTAAWLYVRIRDAWTPEVVARRAAWGTAVAGAALMLFVYLAGHEAVTDANAYAGLFARQSVPVALGYPLVLAATLLAVSLGPTWLALPVSNRPLRWLADISYGVYLIHFAVIFLALHELGLPQSGTVGAALVWSAVVYPASIAFAYLSAKYLERPVRRRAHRYGRRARPEASRNAVA